MRDSLPSAPADQPADPPTDAPSPHPAQLRFTRSGLALGGMPVFTHDEQGGVADFATTNREGWVSIQPDLGGWVTAVTSNDPLRLETWMSLIPGEEIRRALPLQAPLTERGMGAVSVDIRAWPTGADRVEVLPTLFAGEQRISWSAPSLARVDVLSKHLLGDGRLEMVAIGRRNGAVAWGEIGILAARDNWDGFVVPIKQWHDDFLTVTIFDRPADLVRAPAVHVRKMTFESSGSVIAVPLVFAEQTVQFELRHGPLDASSSRSLVLPTTSASPGPIQADRLLYLRNVRVTRNSDDQWLVRWTLDGPPEGQPRRTMVELRGPDVQWRFWLPPALEALPVPDIELSHFELSHRGTPNSFELDLQDSRLVARDDTRVARSRLR